MALAQRLTNTGVLQTPGIFDENTIYGGAAASKLFSDGTFQISAELDEITMRTNEATAVYPSTVTGTGLLNTGTGTFSWTCPVGVTYVSVVCVGGGGGSGGGGAGGGGGGALAYINNYSVTPGVVYTVVCGAGGLSVGGNANGTNGGQSYFNNVSTVAANGGIAGNPTGSGATGGAGGTVAAGTGFAGGAGGNGKSTYSGGGGGGAGGYTAAGGAGGSVTGTYPSLTGSAGSSSASGGGGGGSGSGAGAFNGVGGTGGGVGLLGSGTGGAGGATNGNSLAPITSGYGSGGGGGSYGGVSGSDGAVSSTTPPANQGSYGGGAGGSDGLNSVAANSGSPGAVRIVFNNSNILTPNAQTKRKQTASSYQVYDSIDEVSLAYTITPDRTIMNEGDTVTYTINAPLLGSGTLYYTNAGTTAAADFSGGIVYGVTPLTWTGTATATLWSFTGITQLSTSGFGTGAVFSIRKNNATTTMGTHGVLTVIPTSPGSGYTIGDTIVIDGASLGLTTTTNNLTITVGSDWFAQVIYSATITGTGMVTSGTGFANWTCPDGVYRISVAAVGGGGGGGTVGSGNPWGGGGGGCGYITDIAVVPGTVYPVVAGIGGASTISGGDSYFQDTAIGNLLYCYGGYNGTIGGGGGGVGPGTGFNGGSAGLFSAGGANGGGGGAGGLTAIGGDGGNAGFGYYIYQLGKNSASGGGGGSCGGGAGVLDSAGGFNNTSTGNGGGGGGVLLVGVSNLGLGGVNLAGSTGAILGQSGTGGSGGATGGAASATVGGAGGAFGGGGGGGSTTGGAGGAGALRIIWNYPHGFLPEQTALTAVTNTKLLTAQSATITDVSGINTITNIATVTAGSTIIPFASTFSYQFNGTTQYLTIPSSSNFVYGATDDFTIEGYLYTSATTINKGLIYKRTGAGISSVNFGTSTTTASRFTLKVANATGSAWTINDETAGTFAISTWYHFAITKTNGVIYLYINGLMVRQYAHTTAIYDNGSVLNIGQDPGGARWVGYLSNIRIIKGTALYYPPSTIVKRNYPDYPFVVDNKGSIPITNGTGTLSLPVGQDILQEGVQDIQLQLRSGSTSGTLLATAPTVLVADTSKPLALPGGGQCWCAYPDYVSGSNLVYTGTPGVFTFTAPKGYTAVSAVAIGAGGGGGGGAGGGGGGGALAYSAAITVVPGTTYTITCGAPGIGGTSGNPGTAGSASSFTTNVIANGGGAGLYNPSTGGAGGTVGAGTGFAGGAGGTVSVLQAGGGGGGAGGYTVAGGSGGTYNASSVATNGNGSATGGAGGAGGGCLTSGCFGCGGGGGGTALFGSVAVATPLSTANAGPSGTINSHGKGGFGSGFIGTAVLYGAALGGQGRQASAPSDRPNGGIFGGGGGGAGLAASSTVSQGGDGGAGAVRIIWGTGRAYPATLTADRVSGYPAAVGNPAGQQ